jgi:hypothetical protein
MSLRCESLRTQPRSSSTPPASRARRWERVITRCITRSMPVPGAIIRAMPGDPGRLPAPSPRPRPARARRCWRASCWAGCGRSCRRRAGGAGAAPDVGVADQAALGAHPPRGPGRGTLPQARRHSADGGVVGGPQASGHAARIRSMPSVRREAGRPRRTIWRLTGWDASSYACGHEMEMPRPRLPGERLPACRCHQHRRSGCADVGLR